MLIIHKYTHVFTRVGVNEQGCIQDRTGQQLMLHVRPILGRSGYAIRELAEIIRVGIGCCAVCSATAGVEEPVLKLVLIRFQRKRFAGDLGSGGIRCVVVSHNEVTGLVFMVDFHGVTLTIAG